MRVLTLSLQMSIVWMVLSADTASAQVEPADQPVQQIIEELDVRVVNVEVVVTDKDGVPVNGLEKDDFRLFVDGSSVPIEYFSTVRVPLAVSSAAVRESSSADVSPELPLLIVYYDTRGDRPRIAEDSLTTLRDRLEFLLPATRGIMLARQGMSLVVEQGFTRDRELLGTAIDRWIDGQVPSINSSDRGFLLSRLDRGIDPRLAGLTVQDDDVLDEAATLLSEVRNQAEMERLATILATDRLKSLVGSVAALPGRKAVLYIGPGFDPLPGEDLFRIWWDKYESIAARLNINSIETEMGLDPVLPQLRKLLEFARDQQVVFYGHDPAGVRVVGADPELGSVASSQFTSRHALARQQWILTLARGTGGVGHVNTADMKGLLREMMDGFRYYYSLGYSPSDKFPERGKLKVQVAGSNLRVRHLDRVVARQGSRGLEALALGALLTESVDNPLEVTVELDSAERQEDGTFVVPMLVKVPIAALTLVPEESRHVGRLAVVVQAQGAAGELSLAAQGVVPIEIPNTELLSSLGGMAGYRLKLRVAAGEQRVAIGVRDEVGLRDSALRMVVNP